MTDGAGVGLTGMEGALITFILTVVAAVLIHYLTGRGKVRIADFNAGMEALREKIAACKEHLDEELLNMKQDRERAWTAHRAYCPEKRDILTETSHALLCGKTLLPINVSIDEIKETNRDAAQAIQKMAEAMAEMAKAQARAVTADTLSQVIREIINSPGIRGGSSGFTAP